MAKVLSFVKLDLITIKPYLTVKNLLILLLIGTIMSWTADTNIVMVSVIIAFGAVYSSYPFIVGEKSNTDVLFSTLSIKRDTVVLGRYLFAVFLIFCAACAANVLSLVIFTFTGKDFNLLESLTFSGVVFLLFGLIQMIQIPIFFKVGYTKAKFVTYIPMVGIPAAFGLFSATMMNVFSKAQMDSAISWLTANPALLAVALLIVWLLLFMVSYSLALRFYRRRDF